MVLTDHRRFLELIEKHPTLSAWGIGSVSLYESLGIDLEDSRSQLRTAFEEFELCCLWLSKCRITANASLSSPSSYEVKGEVERSFQKNVSNGALIAAALYLGVPVFVSDRSPRVHVGVSRLFRPSFDEECH